MVMIDPIRIESEPLTYIERCDRLQIKSDPLCLGGHRKERR